MVANSDLKWPSTITTNPSVGGLSARGAFFRLPAHQLRELAFSSETLVMSQKRHNRSFRTRWFRCCAIKNRIEG